LADNASASVERDEPELIEGVRQIREGGRMPSLSHPVRLPERDRASLEWLLRVLIDNGLQGLEAYHSEHSPEDTALYKDLAAKFNLIETGGTDFHGENKPAIHLGTGKRGNVNTPYALLEGMFGVAELAAR
jgi:3',5'-nucleoside bisphosphate phosphatase